MVRHAVGAMAAGLVLVLLLDASLWLGLLFQDRGLCGRKGQFLPGAAAAARRGWLRPRPLPRRSRAIVPRSMLHACACVRACVRGSDTRDGRGDGWTSRFRSRDESWRYVGGAVPVPPSVAPCARVGRRIGSMVHRRSVGATRILCRNKNGPGLTRGTVPPWRRGRRIIGRVGRSVEPSERQGAV